MITFFNYFVKITGWLPAMIILRTRILYEDKTKQSRKIKGAAILVSNHTSVYDFALYLFVFFFRTLRYQMAEVLYKKKLLALFLRCMGGIFVNRNNNDLSFIDKSKRLLAKGKVVGVFPESRLPKEGETRPLPFKSSVVKLALESGAPIIPLYTYGNYFTKSRAKVVIGTKFDARSYYDVSKTEKENIEFITTLLRDRIIKLGKEYEEK